MAKVKAERSMHACMTQMVTERVHARGMRCSPVVVQRGAGATHHALRFVVLEERVSLHAACKAAVAAVNGPLATRAALHGHVERERLHLCTARHSTAQQLAS